MRSEPQKRGLLCLRLGGGRAECQTGQEEKEGCAGAGAELGGLVGGTVLAEA